MDNYVAKQARTCRQVSWLLEAQEDADEGRKLQQARARNAVRQLLQEAMEVLGSFDFENSFQSFIAKH